jgi:hypothetical protein
MLLTNRPPEVDRAVTALELRRRLLRPIPRQPDPAKIVQSTIRGVGRRLGRRHDGNQTDYHVVLNDGAHTRQVVTFPDLNRRPPSTAFDQRTVSNIPFRGHIV